ncbi:MAG: 2-oxo acid dehydrogenase subunit E2 [Proteobacteria bacterium]|nr:2-oxo acid dehydrogenase subunit E2 [Pseudomonadota bacterium]
MSIYDGDEVTKVDPGRKILIDAHDAARRVDGYAIMLLDLLPAKEFRGEFRKKYPGVPLTYLHLIIKTCALVLRKYPWANAMMEGYKIIKPSSIDVGVSVAGEENVAPVVVIREADKKGLKEIVEEVRAKTAQALREEEATLAKLRRIGRLLPFAFLRRMVLRYLSDKYRLKREVVGTVQITMMNTRETEIMFTTATGTTAQLAVGGVADRPLVVGDKIEIRPSVYVTIQLDHRTWHPRNGSELAKEFRWLMEHPEELDSH